MCKSGALDSCVRVFHYRIVRELPSGTVTFLFSDVEGSTRLLREHGERYAELLSEHRTVLREAFARHGGVEVDTQGDAFFVAFARVGRARRRGRGAGRAPRGTDQRSHGSPHR
jgi:class 3 adenylate cyclase